MDDERATTEIRATAAFRLMLGLLEILAAKGVLSRAEAGLICESALFVTERETPSETRDELRKVLETLAKRLADPAAIRSEGQ